MAKKGKETEMSTTTDTAIFFSQDYRDLIHRPNGADWFHSVPLPDGSRIAGLHEDRNVQVKLWNCLTADVAGKRVLDIGANDGYFSIAASLTGAQQVTALNTADCATFPGNISYVAKQWGVAPEVCVGDFQIHKFDGPYDVILFLGVLYHVENIFSTMKLLSSLLARGGALFIETQMSQILDSSLPIFEAASDIYPTIAVQSKKSLGLTGVSNFLFPNEAAMQNLAHSYDFSCERLYGDYTKDYLSRGVFKLVSGGSLKSRPVWSEPLRWCRSRWRR
jgi:2-polyprenyl-3-methyl-5-hydroxy-6-metoxy-1,4-benzoquinol methylase